MADGIRDIVPRPTGRPSTYDRTTADAILIGIAEMELSMREACLRVSTPIYPNGLPPGTFCGWVVDDVDGLSERYMRARRIRAHGHLDEMIEIADDDRTDFEMTEDGPRFNGKAVQRAHLRVETRKWALSRMLRNEFGDKVQVEGRVEHEFVAGAAERLTAKLGGVGPAPGAETPAAEPAPVRPAD